ncbi:MAG: hypothetical protein ACOC32_04335 [Nanoarchaeota archaeon]
MTEDSVPIILLDWNTVKGKECYQDHFVPIVGYDDENVYAQSLVKGGAFMPIEDDVFEKAHKADGTDEDIAVI